jgi:cytochrome c-type biogenesis protein CcmH
MNPDFLLFIALSAAAAVVFLGLPLLRRPAASAVRADYDMRVYKDQLGEVDRDLARGLLTEPQAEAARLELQRRLLAADSEAQAAHKADGKTSAGEPAGRRKTRQALAFLLIFLAPVGAMVLYGALGKPGMADHPFIAQQAQRLGVSVDRLEELHADADVLEAQAQEARTDQALWLKLAQARAELRQPSQALIAYDQALPLGPVTAETWASVGEAHVMASDGSVTEQARAAFLNALRQDRTEPRSRYYLGLAQVQDGHGSAGMAMWRDLSDSSPADAPWRPMLRARMGQLAQRENLPPMAVSAVHPLDLADGKAEVVINRDFAANQPAPAEGDTTAPSGDFTPDQMTMITGMVQRLKDRLAEQPDDYEGWMRLGQSLRVLKDPGAAAEAYGKAAALKTGQEALDPLFAQALALIEQADAAGQENPGEAFFAVVDQVKAAAPEGPEALYLGGLAASIKGDVASARSQWETLRATMPPDGEAYQALSRQIDALPKADGS